MNGPFWGVFIGGFIGGICVAVMVFSFMRDRPRRTFADGVDLGAQVCEDRAKHWDGDPPMDGIQVWEYRKEEAEWCAEAIRRIGATLEKT